MEPRKQTKARNAETPRTETLTFRLNKRLRSLADVAARVKGVTLANHVETPSKPASTSPSIFSAAPPSPPSQTKSTTKTKLSASSNGSHVIPGR